MPNTDDYVPIRSYQDDLDVDGTDPLASEREDDPVKGFGVPPDELKDELDKIDLDEPDSEDARERIEDLDEDPDQESLSA
jgi:hypothetical protein